MSIFTELNPVVLADTNRFSLFNFYPSTEAAEADLPRAMADPLYPDIQYRPMLLNDYMDLKEQHYAKQPTREITEEQYTQAFECLPPICCHGSSGFHSFLMSEFFDGPYTHQYACYRVDAGTTARCFQKLVNVNKRETWMKAGEVPAAEIHQ